MIQFGCHTGSKVYTCRKAWVKFCLGCILRIWSDSNELNWPYTELQAGWRGHLSHGQSGDRSLQHMQESDLMPSHNPCFHLLLTAAGTASSFHCNPLNQLLTLTTSGLNSNISRAADNHANLFDLVYTVYVLWLSFTTWTTVHTVEGKGWQKHFLNQSKLKVQRVISYSVCSST